MTDTDTTPPKLPGDLAGHAKLAGRTWDFSAGGVEKHPFWGPTTLALYGTASAPQLYANSPMRGDVSLYPDRAGLIRFCREVLAFLGAEASPELPPWEPANNGSGKRIWFLLRRAVATDDSIPLEDRYRYGANGNLVRYASFESAQRAAGRLNEQEQIRGRLEYLRGEIQAERISWGEIAELQSLARFIEPGDTELLEWAGVPEQETR